MAADTTEQSGDGNEQKVPEANDKEPSNVSHSDSNELSQWVLGALLRGEAPEQVAKFVATRVHLEDHDYEALQLHLQQHVHAVRALPEKDDGEPGEPIVGEFGKPPPLPKEDSNTGPVAMPLQRLRRNLSELDAIMARLTEKHLSPPAPVQHPHAACTGQAAVLMGRSVCPVAVVGACAACAACAGVQETRGRSLVLPCAQNGMQRGWLEPRVLPVEHRPGVARPQPEREDVVGRQINDFIKARLGSQPVAPPVVRTLSPARRVLHPKSVPGVIAWQSVQGQRVLGTNYQVPVAPAIPAPASRARSTEPRGRCLNATATSVEPRSFLSQAIAPPSGPSRALSATMLTRGPAAHVVMAVPPASRLRPLRAPSPPQKTVRTTVIPGGKSMACPIGK